MPKCIFQSKEKLFIVRILSTKRIRYTVGGTCIWQVFKASLHAFIHFACGMLVYREVTSRVIKIHPDGSVPHAFNLLRKSVLSFT